MAEFTIDDERHVSFSGLAEAWGEFPGLIGPTVDEVLREEGAKDIKDAIDALIPRSGRRWRGKAAPAHGAEWQAVKQEPRSVTVSTLRRYHYLYFPDDGSNTRRHVGNKQMFRRGLETAAPTVIEKIQGALTEAFGEEG